MSTSLNSLGITYPDSGGTQTKTAILTNLDATTSYYNSGNAGTGQVNHNGTQPVGTYALLKNVDTTYGIYTYNSTVAGSNLVYCLAAGAFIEYDLSSVSKSGYDSVLRFAVGTWRCMGFTRTTTTSYAVTLWLRIS